MLDFVNKTDLPQAVGSNIDSLFDLKKFSILERDSPALCADRGDYSPRDIIALGIAEKSFTMNYYEELTLTPDRKMALKSKAFAKEFSFKCIELDKKFYGSVNNIGLNQLSAVLIRRGLSIGLLESKDFDTETCWDLWERLKASKDEEIQKYMYIIGLELKAIREQSRSLFKLVKRPVTAITPLRIEGYKLVSEKVWGKPRCIDPLVNHNEKYLNLSEIDEEFKIAFEKHKVDFTRLFDVYVKDIK